MATASDTMGQCRTKSDFMSKNTNSISSPTPPPLDPVLSHRPNTLKLDRSLVNNPPTNLINEPQPPKISQGVVRGLHLLGLDIPRSVTAKVVVAYTNMLPMDRFLEETCHVDGGVPVQDTVRSPKSLSCQANAGSFKSK